VRLGEREDPAGRSDLDDIVIDHVDDLDVFDHDDVLDDDDHGPGDVDDVRVGDRRAPVRVERAEARTGREPRAVLVEHRRGDRG
jgi:hypothetical protein